VRTVVVETTAEMRNAVAEASPAADVLVMAAAPADFRPAEVAPHKIKKAAAPATVAVVPTDDILLSTRASRAPHAIVVGFALETQAALVGAREKRVRKGLDLVVANDALEPGAGFGGDTNRVTLLAAGREDPEELPLLSKAEVADAILDRVEGLLRGR
jgi:phosphopantothenoylcysteine decarboxylase/phosphopantothenate--cysteine ligase